MNIIGLLGKARSGKDTTGDYLLNKLPNSISLSYAYPLKKEVSSMLDISIEQLDYYKNNNILYDNTNIRKLLQDTGTKNRVNNDLYYVKLLNNKIEECINKGYTNIIITDVRFIVEADELRRFGGSRATIVKLDRDHKEIKESNHSSEQEIDSIRPDYTIYNNRTLDSLYTKVDTIIKHIYHS